MGFKDTVKEQYGILKETRQHWNELLFQGKHRSSSEETTTAIRWLYSQAGLGAPEVTIGENPVLHTMNYLDFLNKKNKEKASIKRKEGCIDLSFVFQKMISRWNRIIKKQMPDFQLYDAVKRQIRSAYRDSKFAMDILLSFSSIDPFILELFPSRWSFVYPNLTAAVHEIQCDCFFQENISAVQFHREYYNWTDCQPPLAISRFLHQSSEDSILQALWSNFGSDINRLYNLIPIYDFLHHTGILTDESFLYIKQLLCAGIGAIHPVEDACLVSRLPVSIGFNGGHLHVDNGPAVIYHGGFQVFYKDGYAYPAKWSLHPDEVDAAELEKLSTRKRLSTLFSLLGDHRTASLLGKKGLWGK